MEKIRKSSEEIAKFAYSLTPEDLAKVVAGAINSFGFDYKAFCKQMQTEHRTLQQTYTNLCLAWIKHLAESDDFCFDGRNEASRRISKEICEKVDVHRLPMI